METRRSVLQRLMMLGVLPAAAARSASGAKPVAETAASPATEPPAPWELLAPLRAGDALGLGWTLENLSPVRDGATVLVLRQGDRQARVHVCRRDGTPRGVAFTERLDLLVMNGGRGDTVTEESLGRVLLGLAPVLARNEAKLPGLLGGLQSHARRLEVYGPHSQGMLA